MANYQRVTLASLLQRLRDRTDGVDVFWNQDEKTRSLNEVLRVWNAMANEWITTVSINAVGTTYYAVPAQISSLTRITYNGTALALTSTKELDYGFTGWEGTLGTPLYWAPIGLNLVALYPTPTTGSILFEGVQETPFLSGPGDFINIGDEELTKFLLYAVHYLSIKEGTKELKASTPYMQDLIKAAAFRQTRLAAIAPFFRSMGLVRDQVLYPIREEGGNKPGVR